jgi:hypothetical protein
VKLAHHLDTLLKHVESIPYSSLLDKNTPGKQIRHKPEALGEYVIHCRVEEVQWVSEEV